MLTNEYCRHKIRKLLTTSCLVLFALIVIFGGSTNWVLAQGVSPASTIAGEVNQKLSEDGSQAFVEKQFLFEPKSGILAEVNQKFHEDYDTIIGQIISTFGKPEGPTVLIFTINNLIIYHNGKREEQQFIPPLYHQLKAIEHHPLALYVTLQAYEDQALTDYLKDFLEQRSNLLQQSLKSLTEENWRPNIIDNQKSLLKDSIEYIKQVLVEGRVNSDKLNNYVSLVRPKIVEGINSAAAEQLEFLNDKIKNLLANDRWKSPYVVICSVHQARHGELVTQYFERVFNEFQGNAAEREDHIIYAESIFDDEPKALRLLATHILDQKLSSAFFKDSKRLQSDTLMDGANFWLWQHTIDIPKWP